MREIPLRGHEFFACPPVDLSAYTYAERRGLELVIQGDPEALEGTCEACDAPVWIMSNMFGPLTNAIIKHALDGGKYPVVACLHCVRLIARRHYLATGSDPWINTLGKGEGA